MKSNYMMIEVFKNDEVCCLSHGTREFTQQRFERYVIALRGMGDAPKLSSIYLILVKSSEMLESVISSREQLRILKFSELIESGKVEIVDRGINVS